MHQYTTEAGSCSSKKKKSLSTPKIGGCDRRVLAIKRVCWPSLYTDLSLQPGLMVMRIARARRHLGLWLLQNMGKRSVLNVCVCMNFVEGGE